MRSALRNPRSATSEPRLASSVGAAEREADLAASRVLMGRPSGSLGAVLGVAASPLGGDAAERVRSLSQRTGKPLPAADRAYFGPRFGRDLSDLRLHTDGVGAGAASAVGAAAFARGNDIAFAAGQYAPGTLMHYPRMAHEIAHSLQQRRAAAPVVQRQRPVNPQIAGVPANRYVDAFAEANYDLDYRAVDGNLSRFLTVTYPDGAQIDIDLFSIEDRDVPMVESMAAGRLGQQGRIFPRELTRTTVPRLWAARQEAIAIMEQYNYEFMVAALPAVIFIITLAGAPPLSGSSPVVRRTTRPRPTGTRAATARAAGGSSTAATGTTATRTAAGPTTATAATTAGGGAAGSGAFRIVSNRVLRFAGRDIVVVETSAGRQAFYRRTGLGGANAGGAQAGQWAPFDGILAGWFDKARYVAGSADDVLFRFGTAENRAASEWLGQQSFAVGRDVGEVWSLVNQFLQEFGALRTLL